MKICFASDIHIDFSNQRDIEWPEADALIVAGDVANNIGEVHKFFNRLNRKKRYYEHVFYVDGNHEHYANANQRRSIAETRAKIIAGLPENVTPLWDVDYARIGRFYVVGDCGWYSCDSVGEPAHNRAVWRTEMNDATNIGFGIHEPTMPWDLAEQHAARLRVNIEKVCAIDSEARLIVVTHMAPHRLAVSSDPKHLTTNPFYVNTHMTPLMADFKERIEVWHHGHTHHRGDKMIDSVYVVANPRGYPRENPGWEPVVIEF